MEEQTGQTKPINPALARACRAPRIILENSRPRTAELRHTIGTFLQVGGYALREDIGGFEELLEPIRKWYDKKYFKA